RLPDRSERRFTVVALRITMSCVVFPSPWPFSTSSEVTQVIRGLASARSIMPWHRSLISIPQSSRDLGTYWWFGGQRVPPFPTVTTGGVVSTTATLNPHCEALLEVSVAVQLTGVLPSGKVDPEGGTQPTEATAQLSVAV